MPIKNTTTVEKRIEQQDINHRITVEIEVEATKDTATEIGNRLERLVTEEIRDTESSDV